MKPTTSSLLMRIFAALFAAFFVTFLYTFFHEGGHALVGIVCGGTLTGFNVNFFNLSAHVDLTGNFSAAQESIKSIAGALLPLVVWILFIGLAPKKANLMVELVKWVSSFGVAGSLLPWAIIPVLFKFGAAPAGDDVTAFLTHSHWNVYLVSTIFIAAIALVIGMFWMKADLKALRNLDFSGENSKTSNKKAFLVMIVIMALGSLAVIMINDQAESLSFLNEGYRLVKVVKLPEKDYNSEPIYRLAVNEDRHVKIFVAIKDINTKYIDIRLTGAGNYDYPMLHGEGYWTNYDKCDVDVELKKGEYQIELTSKKSKGKVYFYVKMK